MKKILFTLVCSLVAVNAFAIKYAVEEERRGESCVRVVEGDSTAYNLAIGAVYPVGLLPLGFHSTYIIEDGVLREKTTQEKQDYLDSITAEQAAQEAALAQEVADWNNSKTNFPNIIKWENRFMLRVGQISTLLMNADIIAEPLTASEATPSLVAVLVLEDPNLSSAALGTALERCSQWSAEIEWGTKVTEDAIGLPPDGKPLREYITLHE